MLKCQIDQQERAGYWCLTPRWTSEGFCPYNLEDRPSSSFPFYLASWNFLRVTEMLANSSVRTVMGLRVVASRISVTGNLTCEGLPSGIPKIVVINCSCREIGVHLQRMSVLKCVFLSPGRFRAISIGFIQWSVNYSNRLVPAHNLRWRRVLEETFDKRKICRFRRTRKSGFFPSLKFFRVDFVTFSYKIVG